MDCKKALAATEGDMNKAVEFLREKGLAGAAKKAGRIAAEGIVVTALSADEKSAVVVEVNAETDFVAKNEKFQTYAADVAAQALNTSAADMDAFMEEKWEKDPSMTVKEALSSQISIIGENMNIRRFEQVKEENGFVASYIHAGGKIGVLVDVETDVVNDAVKMCIRDRSEFVPGTSPLPMNFPMRNRIISGLSDAVILVEAREKSGSLITADLALEQGKEVFAVPGRITDPLSRGCNRLIQNGAAVCLGPEDVLEAFGIKFEKKTRADKKTEKRLAKNENMVYSFLDSRSGTLEEIMDACGLSVTETMECLLKLELMGMVQGNGDQYYCRKL